MKTRFLLLAAGLGSRLMPYTAQTPKCLVKVLGVSVLGRLLRAIRKVCPASSIHVVTGYRSEQVRSYDEGLTFTHNENYATSNMCSSILCAEQLFDGTNDVVISYTDIIFAEDVLSKLVEYQSEGVCVVVDKCWEEYWEARMEDPLSDLESLRVSKGKILDIGQPVTSLSEIQGQYIGLIKISKSAATSIFGKLKDLQISDPIKFSSMYLTEFLQMLIRQEVELDAVFIDGGWLEFDTPSDLVLGPEFRPGLFEDGI